MLLTLSSVVGPRVQLRWYGVKCWGWDELFGMPAPCIYPVMLRMELQIVEILYQRSAHTM